MARRRILKDIELSRIAAVDFPCQEHALMTIVKRAEKKPDWTDKRSAPVDGDFPINDKDALKRAIQSIGKAKDYDARRRMIMRRARALGATDLLPAEWNVSKALAGILAEELLSGVEYGSIVKDAHEAGVPGDVLATLWADEAELRKILNSRVDIAIKYDRLRDTLTKSINDASTDYPVLPEQFGASVFVGKRMRDLSKRVRSAQAALSSLTG